MKASSFSETTAPPTLQSCGALPKQSQETKKIALSLNYTQGFPLLSGLVPKTSGTSEKTVAKSIKSIK